MSVPIKITIFQVRRSEDPAKPITVALLYEGPGKDMPREGLEIDVTLHEAQAMARALEGGCAAVVKGAWSVMRS